MINVSSLPVSILEQEGVFDSVEVSLGSDPVEVSRGSDLVEVSQGSDPQCVSAPCRSVSTTTWR